MTPPEFDQALAGYRDTIPRTWMALYRGCLDVGFNEVQAMALLQTHILGQNPYGIRPGDAIGPKGDEQ